MSFTKKEKQIFWYGIGLATLGGILGNLFVSIWSYLLIENANKFWWGEILLWIVFLIIFLLFVGFAIWIGKTLKKVDNIKRGRPKTKK